MDFLRLVYTLKPFCIHTELKYYTPRHYYFHYRYSLLAVVSYCQCHCHQLLLMSTQCVNCAYRCIAVLSSYHCCHSALLTGCSSLSRYCRLLS